MKVRLKTAEQLEKEFGFEFNGEYSVITFNNMWWVINDLMFKYLGKEIEIEKFIGNINYTHRGKINDIKWYWHELWFEPEFIPIEFINEDEFEI